VQKAGPRKLILFSHHQPFSRLDKQGPSLQTALADLFQKKGITAWYWGHEQIASFTTSTRSSRCSAAASATAAFLRRARRR
jgi:hypothetical protein